MKTTRGSEPDRLVATEFRATVMASRLSVIVTSTRNASVAATRMMIDCLDLLQHLEALWSRFIPTSDVSRINNSAGRPVVVSPQSLVLADRMVAGWSASGGLYDPSILPALVATGYGASKSDPMMITRLPTASTRIGGMADVEIDHEASTVLLPQGVAIDPGGIGKGLASDLAVEAMLNAGAEGALVSIGGDLCSHGQPSDPLGWVINVERPIRGTEPCATVVIDGGGVSTSSTVSRTWQRGTELVHHIIDPFTGSQSSTDLVTATVFASTGWMAEVHSSAAILVGSSTVLDYFNDHGLTGLAVTRDGVVLRTGDLANRGLS